LKDVTNVVDEKNSEIFDLEEDLQTIRKMTKKIIESTRNRLKYKMNGSQTGLNLKVNMLTP